MFANNMMVMNMGFPDVCLEGPIPVPFPNISETEEALPSAPNILIEFTPAQTLLSWVVMSEGDVGLGVASGMCMGPTIPLVGSFTVLAEAMPMTRMTSMNLQNLSNCPGLSLVPGQFTVLCLAP
ncbi:Domain of unknown function DUF4150 [Burkholderiaceae bacterium]|jgi:hypothetical protein